MPDTDDPRPRPWWRRPFVRLSVRGLMVLVLALGGGLGWLVNRAATHRQAVEVLRKAAASGPVGYVVIDDLMVRDGKTSPAPKWASPVSWSPARLAPAWLRKALGDDAFAEPRIISLDFARLKDPDPRDVLAAVSGFRGLEMIAFSNPPAGVSIRGFPELLRLDLLYNAAGGEPHPVTFGDLPKLHTVIFSGDGVADGTLANLATLSDAPALASATIKGLKVTGPGLRQLTRLSKLRFLSIECPNLTDGGLEGFANLKGLQQLRIRGGPGVTDAGLAHLDGLTNLTSLTLTRTGARDVTLERIGRMPSLDRLYLTGSPGVRGNGFLTAANGFPKLARIELTQCPVTDDALAGLSPLKALEHLVLSGTKVRGPGLEHLAALPNLRELALAETAVDDAGLAHVEPLKPLQALVLAGDPITSAGLAHVAGLTELRALNVSNTRVDDAGLDHLRGLSNLQKLYASSTGVTENGIARLRSALPTLGTAQSGKPDPKATAATRTP